jgi:hypothetical protein
MDIGCGEVSYDEFLLNVESPNEDFLDHIENCDKCKKDYVELKMALLKMDNSELSYVPVGLKFGRILVKLKSDILEIIDSLSGTRYGAKLAFRGDGIVASKREVVYESKDLKIFVDLYDAKELVMSIRIYDYGDIYVYDSLGRLIRSSSGKSGVDLRVSEGVYKVRYRDYEIVLEFLREE